MFLPALVAVSGLLGTGWALPAEAAATPAAEPAARYTPALEVTIDSLTPSYIPEEGPIRITGSVTNVDDVPWVAVKMYSFLDDAPMTTTEELAEAADGDPLDAVGERITDEPAADLVGNLEPGQTARYSLAVSRSLIETNGAGVYWFGVHAMGQSDQVPRDDVADGRARTFLPYVPPSTPGSVKTALVLPLRHFLSYAADGSLEELDHWQRTLSLGGRLRDLVDFGASAGSRPVTWLVDPALPDAVRRLASGNPARSLAPTEPPPGEDPAQNPSSDPSATTGPDPVEEADLTEKEQAARDAALAWLARLRESLQGDDVLALPYGDLDVAAAANLHPQLYETARLYLGDVLTDWGVVTSPAVISPSGHLNASAFALVPDDTTVAVTDEALGADPPGVADIDGKTVAVLSSGAAEGGPAPGNRLTSVQLRQRILSEAATRLLSPGRHPLVVSMPQKWQPGDASAFFSGLDADWIELTSVADATDRDGSVVDPADLGYPATQLRRELTERSFAAVDELIASGETLQNLLARNTEVAATVTDEALSGASYGSREVPLATRGSLRASSDRIRNLLGSVKISAGPGVTLSGSDGGFAAVISNGLDEPVTVDVVAQSNGGVDISPLEPVELAANARSTVVLDAHANRSGVTNVTLTLTDIDGNPLGSSAELPIRSAQVSMVIWVIIGAGVGLLFLAIAVRIIRRIRRRSTAPAPETPSPETPAPETPAPAIEAT